MSISQSIQNLIQQGDSLLLTIDGAQSRINNPGQQFIDDTKTKLFGTAAGLLDIGIKRDTSKHVRARLKSTRDKEKRAIERQLNQLTQNWFNSIETLLKTISVKKQKMDREGNSNLLIKKIRAHYRYKKPETRVRHAISTLKEIEVLPLLYNSDIEESLLDTNESYGVLKDLENMLRKCIQTELSNISPNWWQTRIPNDVRTLAEERKRKNEIQWPWFSAKDIELINFLDFNDYIKIISKRDNWNECFQKVFKDKDVLSTKLKELDPIRKAIAHSRNLDKIENIRLNLHAHDLKSYIGNKG